MPLRGPNGALIIGDAETVTKKILYINEALGGISRITFQMGVSTLPHAKMMHAIEILGDQRRPHGARRACGECSMSKLHRCAWAESDPLLREYHDEEWGVPEHDSRALWELLMLEGFQAGLAWITVLRKREAFREAFHGFDPQKVAAFGKQDVTRLLGNPGIIRSRAKIEATIHGARIFEEMKRDGEDFSEFAWKLAGGKPIKNKTGQVPAKTAAFRRDFGGAQKARLQVCWSR